MSLHRSAILTESEITTGFRLNYLANFFVGPVYSEVSRVSGLARSEFVVLFCLQHSGTLTAQDVCDITGRPKNSISQAVNKLVVQGLIKRQTDTTDGGAQRRRHASFSTPSTPSPALDYSSRTPTPTPLARALS